MVIVNYDGLTGSNGDGAAGLMLPGQTPVCGVEERGKGGMVPR